MALLVHQEDPQRVAVLSLTPDTAAAHLALWRDVISQVPAEIAESPLVIAGMAAWIDGDGASAAITAERAARLTDDGISRVTGRPSSSAGWRPSSTPSPHPACGPASAPATSPTAPSPSGGPSPASPAPGLGNLHRTHRPRTAARTAHPDPTARPRAGDLTPPRRPR
ncbi:MAG: DUF4192 family protein [Micropruina sp.]|nr:MAG: DUF4192 family protein [Micropruina sp.]